MPVPAQGREFLNLLGRARTRHEGLPVIEGMTQHEVEAMLLDLAERGLIRVHGPPNQNSDLGKDVDWVELTNLGFMTAD
ncbi:MAG TPA: hypothetical protein VGW40_13650 [Allosphingosinicella sp.]|nr:hypothetical protein [Allosphingosinicella sp.]